MSSHRVRLEVADPKTGINPIRLMEIMRLGECSAFADGTSAPLINIIRINTYSTYDARYGYIPTCVSNMRKEYVPTRITLTLPAPNPSAPA